MQAFNFDPAPTRIVFGAGRAVALGDEMARLGDGTVLVISTPRGRALAERLAATITARRTEFFDGAVTHVPSAVAESGLAAALTSGAASCLAIGGGSAIGLAKILARDLGLPYLAIPTTYAGSEQTAVWGVTDEDGKVTGTDPRVRPDTVIYDPELTTDLPAGTSIVSGFNALAHAVEALYDPGADPVTRWMAEEGARAMLRALPLVQRDGHDLRARTGALYGAWLCGAALGAATMGLHHKICHVLGGSAGLPHADTHAIVLPYVIAFNQSAAARVGEIIAEELGLSPAGESLRALANRLGVPLSLREIGLDESLLPELAERIAAAAPSNPRPVDRFQVADILAAAWRGDPASPVPDRGE